MKIAVNCKMVFVKCRLALQLTRLWSRACVAVPFCRASFMRYCDRLHISTSTNDACSTVFDKSNYPYPPAAPNMGQWSWEGPTLCPWARHLSNLKDLNGPSPLAILWKLPSLVVLLSPRLNFSLILCPPLLWLLWWKHRYKNRMKWGTAGQCVS